MKMLFYFVLAGIFISCHCSKQNAATAYAAEGNIPACVQVLIDAFKQEEKKNPPREIFSYQFNNKLVYYVTAPCCDFFSDLYDENCILIAHPDGGITGRGDGKAPDFIKSKTNEKLIWKDERN